MTEATTTATWGERWLASMSTPSRSFAENLDRGSYYTSRGAVRGLELGAGRASATVVYGRHRPQTVTIDVVGIDDDAWDALVVALAGELRFAGALVEGDLPVEVEDVAAAAGAPLVPSRDGVDDQCICTEHREPCHHVAAVHHALAKAITADPSALLRLRGRDRKTLLAAIRAHRSGTDLATAARSPDAVAIDDLDAAGLFDVRGDLDAIRVQPHPADDPAWLFDHLGDPPGFDDSTALQDLVARAAETAWRIAAGDGAEAADEELLLAELRAQRMATAGALAEALGWDVEVARDALDRLFEEGTVMRGGSGDGARYRAGA
ncbi:MAG: hypothetical protein ACLGIR_00880 [Actinomycetes bacterium]